MTEHIKRRLRRTPLLLGLAVTVLGGTVLAGVVVARTFTLSVARNATVSGPSGNTVHEGILVTARGAAVYTLSGDSKSHPKCTKSNGCFGFWPPVKVSSARHLTHASGVKGRLGTWRRNGFVQVTLGGHPLYTFSQDSRRATATGEGLHTFGGVWHVVRVGGTRSPGAMTPPASPSPSPSPYPPGY